MNFGITRKKKINHKFPDMVLRKQQAATTIIISRTRMNLIKKKKAPTHPPN